MESVVINNSAPANQSSSATNGFNRIITVLLWIVGLAILVTLIIVAYLLIDNWDYIITFFTTGIIGWLNPFDDPQDDKGPVETAVGNVLGEKGETALGLAWWWPGNWF